MSKAYWLCRCFIVLLWQDALSLVVTPVDIKGIPLGQFQTCQKWCRKQALIKRFKGLSICFGLSIEVKAGNLKHAIHSHVYSYNDRNKLLRYIWSTWKGLGPPIFVEWCYLAVCPCFSPYLEIVRQRGCIMVPKEWMWYSKRNDDS